MGAMKLINSILDAGCLMLDSGAGGKAREDGGSRIEDGQDGGGVMTRTGKIARLPWGRVRQQLNQRLADGVPGA